MSSPKYCVKCHEPLSDENLLIDDGRSARTFYYCGNTDCNRFGLMSIVRLDAKPKPNQETD